jgi:hypothetical protein
MGPREDGVSGEVVPFMGSVAKDLRSYRPYVRRGRPWLASARRGRCLSNDYRPEAKVRPRLREPLSGLLDDLDDAVGSRVDQYGPVVHDRVAIIADAILSRHLVIGHT